MIRFKTYDEAKEFLYDTKDFLHPGDVGVQGGRSFISSAIRFFRRSDVNHAWIADKDNMCIEACWNGVRRRHVINKVEKGNIIRVYRGQPFTGEELQAVMRVAKSFISKPYAYEELVFQAPDSFLEKYILFPISHIIPGLPKKVQLFSKYQRRGAYICSEVVAEAYYRGAGYFFGKDDPAGIWDVKNTTPDEIDEQCKDSLIWNTVLEMYEGEKSGIVGYAID